MKWSEKNKIKQLEDWIIRESILAVVKKKKKEKKKEKAILTHQKVIFIYFNIPFYNSPTLDILLFHIIIPYNTSK